MLKVLLINPYATLPQNYRTFPVEPLGLMYLATYANKEIKRRSLDIKIHILDTHLGGDDSCIKTKRGYRSGLDDAQLEEALSSFQPDIVGVTNNFTAHVSDALEIIRTVKNVCSNCIIAIGGAHATIAHTDLIKHPEIELVVRGEGEETFWEIVLAFYEKRGFKEISGITYKEKEEIRLNQDRDLIQDLDALPIPDRSLIPYEKYLSYTVNNYFTTMNKPVGTVFSSRGCHFRCVFCSTQKVWRNKWRSRSPENIIKEIEYLKTTYGVREIAFQDDQFMGDKERIIELCKLIKKRNLNLSFTIPPGISPSLINDNVIDIMSKTGFYRICFSVDVGTKAARAFVKKPVDLDKMRIIVKKANSKGFWTDATFVIGFPYESEKDIKETIQFAYRLHVDFLRFYIAAPHLGSKLYDIYKEKGWLNTNTFERDDVQNFHSQNNSLFGTEYLSAEQVEALQTTASINYLKFYFRHFLNPVYTFTEFLPKILSMKKLMYSIRLVVKLLSMYLFAKAMK